MKAADVKRQFDYSLPDFVTQPMICQVLAVFREVLMQFKVSQKGIVGIIAKIGIGRVVDIIDEYLAANCG